MCCKVFRMDRVCFYHAGCPDGFGAAWSVWRRWGDRARYVPRGHEDPLLAAELAGAQVVFVDIAPPNAALRSIAKSARQITVLDHHVSSQERYEAEGDLAETVRAGGHEVHFDLSHCGSILAWNHFHPDAEVPELLRYVEDQDLWQWKLPGSREVNAAIGSYPRSFPSWEKLAARAVEELVAEGASIVRAQRVEIEQALQNAHPVWLGHQRVEAVNALHQRSQIGHELATRARFGVPCGLVYRVTGRRVDCSIYSIGDHDVAAIATAYGGGGHHNAAGFSVALDDWLERFA